MTESWTKHVYVSFKLRYNFPSGIDLGSIDIRDFIANQIIEVMIVYKIGL